MWVWKIFFMNGKCLLEIFICIVINLLILIYYFNNCLFVNRKIFIIYV